MKHKVKTLKQGGKRGLWRKKGRHEGSWKSTLCFLVFTLAFSLPCRCNTTENLKIWTRIDKNISKGSPLTHGEKEKGLIKLHQPCHLPSHNGHETSPNTSHKRKQGPITQMRISTTQCMTCYCSSVYMMPYRPSTLLLGHCCACTKSLSPIMLVTLRVRGLSLFTFWVVLFQPHRIAVTHNIGVDFIARDCLQLFHPPKALVAWELLNLCSRRHWLEWWRQIQIWYFCWYASLASYD